MSINKKRFSCAALICAEILLSARLMVAQDLEADIKINPNSPNIVQVSGRLLKKSPVNWFFTKTAASADNLGARIFDFQLFDRAHRAAAVKKLIDGEYLADAPAADFQYRINLAPLPNAAARAHVSWISGEQGILMLDDLLPQFSPDDQPPAALIKIELPADWKIISGEKSTGGNVFEVKNVVKAVFAVGKGWRERKTAHFNWAISGEWRFSDDEAAQTADEIGAGYEKLFGEMPGEKAQIMLAPLPKTANFGRWEAETRGQTLTILSADKPFPAQSIQLLHEQLRHELFHLWIPNNLNLNGNYDWFYEGFTVYLGLRTGLRMNRIRFEDFLATLAEAYRLDNLQTTQISLLESSKNRWNGANRQVYARGMLIAFLCDAAIIKSGKGGRSIENLLREIYDAHRFPNEAANGNTAILSVLKKQKPLNAIVKKYVEGAEKIDWESDLESFGIEAAAENSRAELRVKAKLNGRQKDLLDKLGYNNWRNISRKSK